MEISIVPLTTHAWAASQRFTMTLKLKAQHYKSKLKWKGDRGASKTLHMPVSKFTIHLKLYIIKLIILQIKTESHNHIK